MLERSQPSRNHKQKSGEKGPGLLSGVPSSPDMKYHSSLWDVTKQDSGPVIHETCLCFRGFPRLGQPSVGIVLAFFFKLWIRWYSVRKKLKIYCLPSCPSGASPGESGEDLQGTCTKRFYFNSKSPTYCLDFETHEHLVPPFVVVCSVDLSRARAND